MLEPLIVTSVTVWSCILQAIVLIFGPIILSCQRIYQNRHQYVQNSHLKTDTIRVNSHFSDRGRMTRLVIETVLSTIISGYIFVIQVSQTSGSNDNTTSSVLLIGSGVHLTACVYSLVLAIVATQNPLPSKWGWTLNAHLCALYFVTLIYVAQSLFWLLWETVKSLEKSTPFVLLIVLNLDLLYSTLTVSNGPSFLDEDGKVVNRSTVESIFSLLFFTWLTPFIRSVKDRGSDLSDEDLPTLPATHRGHNMFYIFGETRGRKLLYRIYKANRHDIISQAAYACILPFLYYATPFFLNKLLIVIQEITAGNKDNDLYLRAVAYVLSMSVFIIIIDLLIARLWYHAQSNVELRVKSMLNLEIYRKTLRRVDTSIISGGKAKSEEEMKTDDDNQDQDEESDEDDDEDNSPTGMIVNLMSTDSARISDFASWWFVLIEDSLQLIVGVYFLYTLLGLSCILGLLCMAITIPINHYNSKLYIKQQNSLMKARDKRVSLMNELLQGIRQIKFFAWEANWTKRVLNARDVELKHLKDLYINEVVFSALWQGSPILFNTIAFWSFTKLEGRELTAPIAFTSITIFMELRSSMTIIPETIVHLFEAMVSINRIDSYLSDEEIQQPISSSLVSSSTPSMQGSVDHISTPEIKIGFENATIGWPSNKKSTDKDTSKAKTPEGNATPVESTGSTIENDKDSFVLKNIDITFPNNTLSLICGATGSGKTLLMLSLLGETETKEGLVQCPRSLSSSTLDTSTAIDSIKVSEDAGVIPSGWILQHGVAYSAQTAWLQNASIKDNILFGLPCVQKRYKATLAACALEKDIFYLEDGDETEIGEKGITLSGGQKARVALARAVYSRAQNVFMDDVLSAVDAHTAKHIYTQCLQGPLMKGRTQILITHHVSLCIKGSSYIVFLKDGRAQLSGTPSDLNQSGQLSQVYEEVTKDEDENDVTENDTIEEQDNIEDLDLKKKPKALVEDENRSSGSVKMRFYKIYLSLFGNWLFWIFVILTIMGARGLNVASTLWLKEWAQSYEYQGNEGDVSDNAILKSNSFTLAATFQRPMNVQSDSNANSVTLDNNGETSKLNMYLGIFVLLNFADLLVATIRYSITYAGGLAASRRLYVLLLDRILRAPLRFFDTTPVGRIVNRFSKDFETIDDAASTNLIQFLIDFTEIISIVIVATSVLPTMVILMVFIAAVNVYFGSQYVSASRELKRMDSVSRSPLFTQFSETIAGVATIRAFGMTQRFMLDMIHKIDANSRPMYYAHTISRWASIRIAVMGSSISLVTGMFILLNLDYIDAATAGFCLSYVLTFTQVTYWGTRRYTELEMDFNAIERVVEYLETDQEAPAITNIRTPANWPTQGAIEVKDLKARYASDLDLVLKRLTFSVKPQEKIGIVGRTGSGKSTLALAFFRFIELCEGSITIDGINISEIGTEDLRSNLTIIPQDPVLFSGTLQSNMDPFDQFSEEEIFTALRRVHLLNDTDGENINENVFKNLQTPVSEGGNNFSQGQRQLLCLARALLKSSRVVLMDEATASVDFETDAAIQKTITTEFSKSTILCIAHRLNTVIEYDRILVLDHGQVVEFASPLELLDNKNSVFYGMCQNSGEFDRLFELARNKHELVNVW